MRAQLVRATGLCQTISKTACLLGSFGFVIYRRTPMNLSSVHRVSFFRSRFFDACREWTYITACCVLSCKAADQSDYPCWHLSTAESIYNGESSESCFLWPFGWPNAYVSFTQGGESTRMDYEEDELLVAVWYLVHYSSPKPILSLICIILWTAAPT